MNTVPMKATGVCHDITFLIIRYIPPSKSAAAQVSPIEPPLRPKSIFVIDGSSPSDMPCIIESGVALLAMSTPFGRVQFDIAAGNEMSIMILAVMAGLAKFLPMPPKSCFTTIIAATLPNTACHI